LFANDREKAQEKQGDALRVCGIPPILNAGEGLSMNDDIILRTVNLGKRFGRRWAVRNLNLEVRRGEVFGFLGPNGAGKSTTIRMLLSLIRPTEGDVELFGRSLRGHRGEILARLGGLVERADFYLYLSGRRNLELIASMIRNIPARAVDEALEVVGLSDRGADRVKTYSHGMKQRLGIAQALLGKPEMVILDEPTSGLDPQGIKDVRNLIRRLALERRTTVFLSSHLLNEIEQTATSMAIINDGALVVQGKVRELLASGEHVLRVAAEPAELALTILHGLPFVRDPAVTDGWISVHCEPHHAADVVRALVGAGVAVHAAVPRRSLEEYFLTITEGAGGRRP
jgi:ABC-2 type transport system ATP-binding protein